MTRLVVCPEPLAAVAGAHVFRLGGSAVRRRDRHRLRPGRGVPGHDDHRRQRHHFGRAPSAAVTSPRVHCEGDLGDVRVEPFFPLPPDVRDALTARGLGLRDDPYGGRVCLIAVDPSGRATGASDPRGGGGLAEV